MPHALTVAAYIFHVGAGMVALASGTAALIARRFYLAGESKIEIVIRLEQRPAPFDIHGRERFKGQDANRNALQKPENGTGT